MTTMSAMATESLANTTTPTSGNATAAMPVEDISSTEEQTLRHKTKVRRKSTGVFAKKTATAPKPITGQASAALLTFTDLVHDHSHVNLKATEKTCALIADKKVTSGASATSTATAAGAAAAGSSTDSAKKEPPKPAATEQELQAAHKKASDTNPWEYTMLKTRLNALPRPSYYPRDLTVTMAKEQIQEAMRRRQLSLPILTATHERKLLQEAGSFGGVDYPACVSGVNCVNVRLHSLVRGAAADGVGFPLTAVMFEEEYSALILGGTQPVSIRPCILCCRKTLCDYVLAMRCARCAPNEASATATQGTTLLLQRQAMYQLYRNLANQPEGFFDMYMLFPKAEEGILDPIVMPNLMSLCLEKDETTGRRRLTQSVMEWRPAPVPKPRVGENEQNFGEGAGSL
jgi:hypothetical protein